MGRHGRSAGRPAPVSEPGATSGRHAGGERRKRRVAAPVRTGLLGASAAMAVGAVAVASGLIPGGGHYDVGASASGGEQVQTDGGTTDLRQQGATARRRPVRPPAPPRRPPRPSPRRRRTARRPSPRRHRPPPRARRHPPRRRRRPRPRPRPRRPRHRHRPRPPTMSSRHPRPLRRLVPPPRRSSPWSTRNGRRRGAVR